jgi:hypothetical protein
MRHSKILLTVALVMLNPPSRARDNDPIVFETWDDYVSSSSGIKGSPNYAEKHPEVSNPVPQSAPTEQVSARPNTDRFLIHFGAGARWLAPIRISDGLRNDKLFPVFSVSVAPFRIIGEVGLDLVMGKDSSFFLEPNLKFFFVKNDILSVYLEGTVAIYSQQSGTRIGGGTGLGILAGLMDHLALEIRAAALVLNLRGEDSVSLLSNISETSNGPTALVLCPSLEARLLARF